MPEEVALNTTVETPYVSVNPWAKQDRLVLFGKELVRGVRQYTSNEAPVRITQGTANEITAFVTSRRSLFLKKTPDLPPAPPFKLVLSPGQPAYTVRRELAARVPFDEWDSYRQATAFVDDLMPAVAPRYATSTPPIELYEVDVKAGEYRGKIPTRISKWYHDQGYTVDKETLTVVGSLIAKGAEGSAQRIFDIDNEFFWRGGSFGDRDSCYFSGGASSPGYLMALSYNGFWAFRFWKSLDGKRGGIARSWFRPLQEFGLDAIAVVNGYGISTDQQAKVLAEFFGVGYKSFSFSDGGAGLYLNSGRYLLGPTNVIERVNHFTLPDGRYPSGSDRALLESLPWSSYDAR